MSHALPFLPILTISILISLVVSSVGLLLICKLFYDLDDHYYLYLYFRWYMIGKLEGSLSFFYFNLLPLVTTPTLHSRASTRRPTLLSSTVHV